MTQNRDREVNFQKNSREFSRIETLAGHWSTHTFPIVKNYTVCNESVSQKRFGSTDSKDR